MLFGNTITFLVIEGIVTVNTDPVHFTTAFNLVFTYNRDIIFGAASYNAGTATGTGVKVNSHHPVVGRAFILVPQTVCFVVFAVAAARERIFFIFS